jgi:hypothetical protein
MGITVEPEAKSTSVQLRVAGRRAREETECPDSGIEIGRDHRG